MGSLIILFGNHNTCRWPSATTIALLPWFKHEHHILHSYHMKLLYIASVLAFQLHVPSWECPTIMSWTGFSFVITTCMKRGVIAVVYWYHDPTCVLCKLFDPGPDYVFLSTATQKYKHQSENCTSPPTPLGTLSKELAK